MTTATAAPVRVTLHGPDGRLDAGVWDATTAASLVADARVCASLGLVPDAPAALVTRAGRRLSPDVPLVDQGVDDGAVLLAIAPGRDAAPAQQPTSGPAAPSPVSRSRGTVLTALLVALGAGAAAPLAAPPVDVAASVLLLLTALLAATAAPSDAWGDLCRVAAPAVAAAGAWAVVAGPGPGQLQVALTAAAVAAAVTAALGRTGRRDQAVADPLLVVLVVAAAVAVLLGVGTVAGLPLRAAAALLAAAGVLAVRLLPSLVVDVPDEALLELERLSVTAWSAHERRRRGAWRRLHADDVAGLLARSRRVHRAAVLCASAAAAGGAVTVGLSPGSGVTSYGSRVLVCGVAVALPLMARGVRDRVGGTALRVGGGLAAVAVGAGTVVAVPTLWRGVVVGVTALAGTAAVVAAVALGRGWRSVRWGRTADILEGLAVMLVPPAAFTAAGGVDWVRQLVS